MQMKKYLWGFGGLRAIPGLLLQTEAFCGAFFQRLFGTFGACHERVSL